MSKSFDRNAAKRAGAKKALPKGGGKGARGENLYTPVSQKTIDKIKAMGMTKALAKAGKTPKGANAEFIQGIKRMYGAARLSKARASFNKVAKSPDQARARNAAATKVSTSSVKPTKTTAAAKPKAVNYGGRGSYMGSGEDFQRAFASTNKTKKTTGLDPRRDPKSKYYLPPIKRSK